MPVVALDVKTASGGRVAAAVDVVALEKDDGQERDVPQRADRIGLHADEAQVVAVGRAGRGLVAEQLQRRSPEGRLVACRQAEYVVRGDHLRKGMKKRRDFPAPGRESSGFRPDSPAPLSGVIRCGSARFGAALRPCPFASVRYRSGPARKRQPPDGVIHPTVAVRLLPVGCGRAGCTGPAVYGRHAPVAFAVQALPCTCLHASSACRSPFRLLRRPLLSCNAPISCSWARASCSSSCLRAWASSPLWQPPPDRWRSAAAGFRPAP